MASSTAPKTAVLYHMVMPGHVCPYGIKAKHLLESKGYTVEDNHLTTRSDVDAFKAEHGVATTPQTFINGGRVGGYDDLRRFFGKHVPGKDETSYRPVLAVFAAAAAMALAVSWSAFGSALTVQAAEWFVAFSMIILAMLKLQDIEKFSTMFLNYDVLARRWVPYGYVYPFAEFTAGALMAAHLLPWVSIPVALFIGGIGAFSVFKAVYIEKRAL
jgi:glutaredoxin